MTAEPKTARGKAIVEAAREMADAAERAATAYEQGCVLTRGGAEDEAATARAEIDRLVADFEDALSAAEERARRAEQQASDAAGLLVAAERQLAEWRACAEEGARLVADARDGKDFAGGRLDAALAIEWADAVNARRIDPAAGTGDHEREPGRMGE